MEERSMTDPEDLAPIGRESREAIRHDPEGLRRQVARDLATQALCAEAHRYALTARRLRRGDTSREQLQACQGALETAAVFYCAAHGHPRREPGADVGDAAADEKSQPPH